MDIPSTYMPSLRGRGGGFGSSNQKLLDFFWTLTTSGTTPTAIMTLLHYYVTIKTAKADTDFNVLVSYPLATSGTATATTAAIKVDGSENL